MTDALNQAQRDDLATLFAEHLRRGGVQWLAETVLGRDVKGEVKADVRDVTAFARGVVEIIANENAVGKAVSTLRAEADRNGLFMLGLTTILHDERLGGAAYQAFRTQFEPFIATVPFEQMFSRVRRAVCAIGFDANGLRSIQGTGFLIGPDLVMTNFHVIEPFLAVDNDGRIKANGDGDKIYCFFDYEGPPAPEIPAPRDAPPTKVAQGAKDWLACARRKLKGDGTPQVEPFTDQLDFAVIRLKRPIGNLPARAGGGGRRGWLSLPEAELDTIGAGKLVLFQHPAQRPQKFDIGPFHRVGKISSRVWYWLDSAPGSSGGATVDTSGGLFALHNAAVKDEAETQGDPRSLNQGIRLDHIRAALKASAKECLVPPPAAETGSSFWSLTDDITKPAPVIGRSAFLDHVVQVAAPSGPRVIVVTGPGKSGVRFSTRLLKRSVGTQVRVIEFLPEDLRNYGPSEFLRIIATELGLKDRTPPSPRPTEDIPRWLREDLALWLNRALEAGYKALPAQFPAWVVIDTIGDKESGGHRLLSWAPNLSQCIATLLGTHDSSKERVEVPLLRWLFLGRNANMFELGSTVRKDEDLASTADHPEDFARCMESAWHALDATNQPFPPGSLQILAGTYLERAEEMKDTHPPHVVLANEVRRYVRKALQLRARP